jgi:molybdenum cofactor cytidylyltransferase
VIRSIVLAAGRSSRFGSDKRQANGPWGGALLHHVLSLYRPFFTSLTLVIGPDDAFGADAARRFQALPVVNPEPERGIGRSLALAIAALGPCDGAVIGLGDMPFVPAALIGQVRDGLRDHGRLIAPWCDGQLGFPRGIPAGEFAALVGLDGDRGAGGRLDWSAALTLAVADSGVLRDIDRPQDVGPTGANP